MAKSEVIARLDYLAKKFDINSDKFARIFGYKDAMSFANAKSKGRILKDEDVRGLMQEIPSLNLNWLFNGYGPILFGEEGPGVNEVFEPSAQYSRMLKDSTRRLEERMDEIHRVLSEIRDKLDS